jgi:hypothetical protein
MVVYDSFFKYFANLSCFVQSDPEFMKIISTIFNLSSLAPPPPMLKVKKGKESTPIAVQHHGDVITWQQEVSNLEQLEGTVESSKGRKVSNFYFSTVPDFLYFMIRLILRK